MLRLAEGVTRSRIIARNGKAKTIRLRITPTANRNSYRVVRLVGVFNVHVAPHPLMLQGIDNDMSGPLWMVRTPGNSVGVAIS